MAWYRRPAFAAVIDVVCVIGFVAIGRRSHDEPGNVVAGIGKVAVPFLIGLAVGWLIAQAWKAPATWRTGIIVWLSTLVIGLLLRRFAFDRGIALPFIIVTTLVTGFLLLGWRAIADRRIS